jgi:hypothetical protein
MPEQSDIYAVIEADGIIMLTTDYAKALACHAKAPTFRAIEPYEDGAESEMAAESEHIWRETWGCGCSSADHLGPVCLP